MAIEDIKALANGVYDLCNDAIERIGTKNEGCIQDIKYYRPSKAKHFVDPAVIGGMLGLSWGGERVATLSVDFAKDG